MTQRASCRRIPILFALLLSPLTAEAASTLNFPRLSFEADAFTGIAIAAKFRTVLSGLRNPTALLGVFRKGVSCPDELHLMVSERGLDRTLLVVPATGEVSDWVPAGGVNDIAFLPSGNQCTVLADQDLCERREWA